MKKEDCIFCKIANGEIPSATIFEDRDFRVMLDIGPATRGHVLILTKEHYDNIYEIDAETAGKLFSLASVIARAMKKVLNCDGMNILQNNGTVAGQTVFHFHLHLIPRYEGDQVQVTWPQGSITEEEKEELVKSMKKEI
ncbi:MAG: HIT family protein [Anaerostipes sp.]|uniref:HIT family protein n=1 Tax=Anaerostipes sp. 992a TaxID=1261637 RepID=UPI0009532079|nr:HIT family protein [Anaerostipes sp. 992a]MCI5952018.1 HIT family protein [Anaerostipes sp.]MDD5969421.1 HIT family protein [Anaerostipes sp.]OLR63124.1 histidine triad (HIT) protein [Anaerostipes sp. 992a]